MLLMASLYEHRQFNCGRSTFLGLTFVRLWIPTLRGDNGQLFAFEYLMRKVRGRCWQTKKRQTEEAHDRNLAHQAKQLYHWL